MTQNELKQAVAAAAAAKVAAMVSSDSIVGVGTGSTANLFIEALGQYKGRFDGAVASSEETAKRLKQQQIPVYDLNAAGQLTVYVDGADEITSSLFAIKGGGAALTREKIVTANAEQFICIADESKLVPQLGTFPLPVEVIPMARSYVARQMVSLGGEPIYRQDVITDNGNVILDVHGLQISDPQALETRINNIVGVVCNGIFAHNPATLLLLGTKNGVKEYQ